MRRVVIAAGVLFWLLPAAGALAMTEAEYELLLAQTPWEKTERGHETRKIELPGGIIIEQKREGGKISSIGMDYSGHGAVLCIWEFYAEFESFLDICRSGDEARKAEASLAIERINKFIYSNDFTNSIVEQQNNRRSVIHAGNLEAYSSKPKQAAAGYCETHADFFRDWLSEAELGRLYIGLDEVLSVPRLPVMNPCL